MNDNQKQLLRMAQTDLMESIVEFDNATKHILGEMSEAEFQEMDDIGLLVLMSVPEKDGTQELHQVAIGQRHFLSALIMNSDIIEKIITNQRITENELRGWDFRE